MMIETKIEKVNINDLKEFPDNPNEMNEKEYSALKNNIKQFGYLNYLIVTESNTVLGGNHRLKVLKELGYSEIEVIKVIGIMKEQENIINIGLNSIHGKLNKDIIKKFFLIIKKQENLEIIKNNLNLNFSFDEEEKIEININNIFKKSIICPYCKYEIEL